MPYTPTSPSPPPSPSTPPVQPWSQPLLRPTTSVIRDKSGQVVKPSLKRRSLSTPNLSRQSDQSHPTTAEHDKAGFPKERSKSVHFRNEDQLMKVRVYLRDQEVTAVDETADRDRAGLLSDNDNKHLDTELDSDCVSFRTRRNAASGATDEAERVQFERGSKAPRIRFDFGPDSKGSLAREHVVLERIDLQSSSAPLTVTGTAIVRNVCRTINGLRFGSP